MKVVIFGLTISSSWGNSHAEFWRGFSRALALRGHRLSFYERDVPVFAAHRDLSTWEDGELQLFSAWDKVRYRARRNLEEADVAIVTSGCPDAVAASALIQQVAKPMHVFHDLDSAVTLDFEAANLPVEYTPPASLSGFDLVLSCTGGNALEELRTLLHAKRVAALYPGVDANAVSETASVGSMPMNAGLSVLDVGNDLGGAAFDRLLIEPARRLPDRIFRIAGTAREWPALLSSNVAFQQVADVRGRRTFLEQSRLRLNLTGRFNQRLGFCPSQSLFETAAMGIPVLSDRWDGLRLFFEPGSEILVADNADDAIAAVELSDAELSAIGRRARERVLDEHTFAHRAMHFETLIETTLNAADEQQLLERREKDSAALMEDAVS